MRTNPNQTKVPNPAERFFEWKAKEGKFVYYDKATKETIDGPKTFIFLVLDELSTIKGMHKKAQKPIYANEVRNIKTEKLVVSVHGHDNLATGLYDDIKDKAVANGGKFCKSVYIAFKDETKALKLGNIQFVGASLGAWFEFTKKQGNKIYEKAVILSGKHEEDGQVTYMVPEFELRDISPDTEMEATLLQNTLAEYLVDYLGQDHSKPTPREANDNFIDNASNIPQETPEPEPIGGDDDFDSLPF
jgi:hypothetical protein